MLLTIAWGSTDVTVYLVAKDSAGARKTDLVFNSAGASAKYIRPRTAGTAITLATQTATGAHADGGFVHVGNGVYRLDVPDAAFASGESLVMIDVAFTGAFLEPLAVGLTPLPDILVATVQSDAGNTAGQFKSDLASSVNDFYKNSLALVISGSLAGQQRKITGYTGSTKVVAVNAFTGTPAAGDKIVIVNQ